MPQALLYCHTGTVALAGHCHCPATGAQHHPMGSSTHPLISAADQQCTLCGSFLLHSAFWPPPLSGSFLARLLGCTQATLIPRPPTKWQPNPIHQYSWSTFYEGTFLKQDQNSMFVMVHFLIKIHKYMCKTCTGQSFLLHLVSSIFINTSFSGNQGT